MNKEELALAVHVCGTTIARYEDGTISKIKIPIIQAIAIVLNVNPLWILGQEDTKELKYKVLDPQYYKFALKMQENNLSEKDLGLMWSIFKLIKEVI